MTIGQTSDPAKSQLDVSLGHIETRGSVGEKSHQRIACIESPGGDAIDGNAE